MVANLGYGMALELTAVKEGPGRTRKTYPLSWEDDAIIPSPVGSIALAEKKCGMVVLLGSVKSEYSIQLGCCQANVLTGLRG